MRKTILMIDDSLSILSAGKSALQDDYRVLTTPSGKKAMALLEKALPDLIILDIDMPDMDGYETIRRIKAEARLAHIPIIFLTAMTGADNELDGLSLGAVDYISKPFTPALLKKRIEMQLLIVEQQTQLSEYNSNLQEMVEEKARKITKLQDAILTSIAELVEFRDGTTGMHIERTQYFLNTLLQHMMKSGVYRRQTIGWDFDLLVRSAQLHDVGKICIPDSILNKPGKLTVEEFETMKLHTVRGREAIERISQRSGENEFLNQAAILAYCHHERWDGTGYPEGLAGTQIPLQGRLMAIADVYDALVSERPYKPPYSHEVAVETILDASGTQFDPVLVKLFVEIADEYAAAPEENDLC